MQESKKVWQIGTTIAVTLGITVALLLSMKDHVLVSDYEGSGYIFSAEQTESVAKTAAVSGPYWAPSFTDRTQVDKALIPYLRSQKSAVAHRISDAIPMYRRQYLGYTDAKGKAILVNAFCNHGWVTHHTWTKDLVVEHSGGDCYFQARYSVVTGQFEDLHINSRTAKIATESR